MAEEIIFSEYQAEVFNEAEQLLKIQGYLGEQLFEDTYVLQKRVADWVIQNVPVSAASTTIADEAMMTYNGVLGIAVDDAPPPVEVKPDLSEPVVRPTPISVRPVPTRPFLPTVSVRPSRPIRSIPKPAIATPVAVTPPPRAVRPMPTSIKRPTSITRANGNGGLFGGGGLNGLFNGNGVNPGRGGFSGFNGFGGFGGFR